MWRAVLAEAIKLKRSSTLLFVVAGGLLPAITSCFYFRTFEWSRHVATSLLFLNLSSLLVVPSLAGYMVSGEYEKQTMSALLSCPVSRPVVLLAKYLVLAAQVACMYLISGAFGVTVGFLRAGGTLPEPEVIGRGLLMALGLAGIHLAIAPAGLFAGLLGRKTVVPILLGLSLVLLYGSFAFTAAGDYIPSCIPTYFVIELSGVDPYGLSHRFDATRAALVLSAWFVLFSCLSVLAFWRKEHCGS